MELKVINEQGMEAAKLQASDVLFGRDFNEALVHQIVVAYQANARSGDRQQKDRSEVRHTTTKPWRQKGTGRARAGSNGSPLWRGGGRIFPNSPEENFSQKVPVATAARCGAEAAGFSRIRLKRISARRLTRRCSAPAWLRFSPSWPVRIAW